MGVAMTWPQYRRGECTVDGFVVRIGRYAADVLFMLMVHYPNPVTTRALVAFLWPEPDDEPEYVESFVTQVVMRLRRQIGAFRIMTRLGFGYCWRRMPGEFARAA